ncbi:TPA: hypothetical protein ACXI16_004011 [Serratia marcescens]
MGNSTICWRGNLCTPIHQFQKSFNEISAESQIYFIFLKKAIKTPRFLIRRNRLKLTLCAADSATKKIPGYSMQINDFLPQRHSLSGRNGKK